MPRGAKLVGLYVGMLAAAASMFFAVQYLGDSLTAASPVGPAAFGSSSGGASAKALADLLLALLVVVAAARLLGALLAWTGQPPVVGEIVAGILLGPSLLGRIAPAASVALFPAHVTDHLGVVAQLGVIAFMFLVGLKLDLRELRGHSRALLLISHTSIVVPFVMGVSLALYLYPRYAASDVPFGVFALFCGVAMSVTAFPVLARIIADRGLQGTPLGSLALACAAADDASAWCLLALVTGVAKADAGEGLRTFLFALGYVALMFLLARPLLSRLARRVDAGGSVTPSTLTLVFAGVLVSSLLTEGIGIHALFGAFLLGALVPHDSRLATELAGKLNDFVVVILLPAFFALTGLRTQLGLLLTTKALLNLALVVAVASIGKFGGAYVSGRFTGLSRRDASVLGLLMNTRGLMELIVLNVGLELGVLSPSLFALLVLMAIVTTASTTPILLWIQRSAPLGRLAEKA